MAKDKIEEIPAISALNRFADKLPPEHRAELYETAEAFLSIGAMHGIFAGLNNGTGKTSEADQQKEYITYLTKKARESALKK